MRTVIRLVASICIGTLLLIPLSAVYGAMGLPVYHSWGLVHGSFTTALPALVAASYVALGLIAWFKGRIDTTSRVIASVTVLALVTVMFWVNQMSHYAFSMRHLVVYLAIFALFTVLCLRAKHPWVVPLFLLVPLLVDPVFGLLITGAFDLLGAKIFLDNVKSNILPIALATGASIVVAKLVRRRTA